MTIISLRPWRRLTSLVRMDNEQFKDRLRSLRGSRTQRAVGEAVDVLALQVSRWERGISHPHPRTMSRLADFFGVDVRWLQFGGEDLAPSDASDAA